MLHYVILYHNYLCCYFILLCCVILFYVILFDYIALCYVMLLSWSWQNMKNLTKLWHVNTKNT